MKFLCLGYFDDKKWETLSQAEQESFMQECFAYDDMLNESGHSFGKGYALQIAETAKTLRWNGSRVQVIDGPFAETKEQLGGLGVLEARDMAEAVELMAKHPGVRLGGPFEIRAIDENSPCGNRHHATKIYVNLPVKNLDKSIEFFTGLGFKFNPQFTDDTATCMIVSDEIFVMLLTEAKFREFTPNAICDTQKSNEVLVCLSRPSRESVDDLVRKAINAGGKTIAESKDYGFMYQHGFQDLDGHIWELIYMTPEGVPQREEAAAV